MSDADKDKNAPSRDTAASSQQGGAGSTSGPYTGGAGAGTERESGFVHANPESNVGPAGAPQTSHGSAADRMDNSQSGTSGSASGGPGTSADGAPSEHQRPIGSLADDKPSI